MIERTYEEVRPDSPLLSCGVVETIYPTESLRIVAHHPEAWRFQPRGTKVLADISADVNNHVTVTCLCPRCKAERRGKALKERAAEVSAEEKAEIARLVAPGLAESRRAFGIMAWPEAGEGQLVERLDGRDQDVPEPDRGARNPWVSQFLPHRGEPVRDDPDGRDQNSA